MVMKKYNVIFKHDDTSSKLAEQIITKLGQDNMDKEKMSNLSQNI